MTVLRIAVDLQADDPAASQAFYRDLFGLDIAMDMGWVCTFQGTARQHPQLTVMRDGGSGQPAPAMSIEVDDFDAVMDRAQSADVPVTYGPADEPWGVRRAFLRDPAGHLVNVLTHI